MFVHPTDTGQRVSIAQAAHRGLSAINGMVEVRILEIEIVRLRGVHPPSVQSHVVQTLEVVPINITGFGRERVIATHSRRIIHARWPLAFYTALRPSGEIEKMVSCRHLPIAFGLRTETRPDGYHQVGIMVMDVVDGSLRVLESVAQKLHGIPKIVRTPILPVLHDTVERNALFAVFMHYPGQFGQAFIAFLALPETVCPQREHRHLSRQFAHLADTAVHRLPVHEIIVHAVGHLGTERHAVLVIVEIRGGVIVPIKCPALHRLDDVLVIFRIALYHIAMGSTAVHLAVL